ncbi:ketopantoate reductase family protein [Planctomicrobium piriforme]|uniref:2-dehydropantoate 2-reductase n=1 Tax=Planctomicrobium piriforme TaxID=1576369 RepID=A0A1I3NFJ3_9PLAN|nr:ketopantoate reductase family protein [Planctomicrobium piriforme]SFJ07939.1 2-dehydropantoate 2-reductase [Planctomicrobium piriforme]
MRILVLGAGAIGGYFGGRLLDAGRDVTFLVRPERAKKLSKQGLSIQSASGDLHLTAPKTLLKENLREQFDLVILSCKAYDLDSSIDAIAPAIGPQTAVLPLLNGMRHLEVLDERLGSQHVLGGTCFISTRLEPNGSILHLSDVHIVRFGTRSPEQNDMATNVSAALSGAGFEALQCENILLDMWEKWIFLASMAGLTCLLRGTIGDVAAADGTDVAKALLDECREIATAAGYPPRPEAYQFALERLTAPGSPIAASMLGDLERGGPTEGEHVLGDLLRRRKNPASPDLSLLRLATLHLRTGQIRSSK